MAAVAGIKYTMSYNFSAVYNTSVGLGGNLSGDIGTVLSRNVSVPLFQHQHYTSALKIVKYAFPIVIAIGTLGNVLSFVVLLRRRMRNTSINTYLAVLAVIDTLVLYLSAFKTWIRVLTGFELLHTSDVGCKTMMFLFLVALHMSAWLVVMVTFDRFVVVSFPFRAAALCSAGRARILAAVLTSLTFVYNLHVFWTFRLQQETVNGRDILTCGPVLSYSFMRRPFNNLKLATYALIPFCFVLIMNTGIIYRICRHSREKRSENIQLEESRVNANKHQVTILLLLISFSWLFLTAPFVIVSMFSNPTAGLSARARVMLAKTVCFLLMYTNHSINFLLYCVAGKRFRREFGALISDLHTTCSSNHLTGQSSWRKRSRKTQNTPPCNEPVVLRELYG